MNNKIDQVGLGWRGELAPHILTHLDQIDIVEVILDSYLDQSKASWRSLQTLSKQVYTIYHGVGLGIASSFPLNKKKLNQFARIIDFLNPQIWSEHLAFVRAKNIEIGHLAAPPRNLETIQKCLENLELVKQVIGQLPALENIATLIDPPNSSMSEGEWTSNIIYRSESNMLLDLHNLYSNAVNFGFNPIDYLNTFPLNKVQIVHLSGGHFINEPRGFKSSPTGQRLLDDHIHDIPKEVYNLLYELRKKVDQKLLVIIERDGSYPEFAILLDQIKQVRHILQMANNDKKLTSGVHIECSIF